MMKIFSRKRFIASTVLVGALAAHSAFAVLINSPAELTGTEGISMSFGDSRVGVGYIRRWTTTEKICKKLGPFKLGCKTKTHHHSANEIQSGSSRYRWDFGDGNNTTGVVSTSGGYYHGGNDQLFVNLPTRTHSYLVPGIYNASLSVTNSGGQTGTRDAVVMVLPSEIVSSDTDVCDINNATVVSSRPFGLWNGLGATPNDIVFIREGHTVLLPRGNTQVQVAGLCIDKGGVIKTDRNRTSFPPNQVVITASAIHNRGTISTANGTNGSIIGEAYEHATAGGSISLFAGRFTNDGKIDARGRGGDDIPYPYFDTASGQIDAWGGDGGHVGIFPNEFINSGSLLAGDGGDAILFKDWANYIYGNAYGGRGGSVNVSAQNMGLSSSSGTLKAGCGGTAAAIGSWLKTIKIKQSGWFSSASFTGIFTGKLFDVAGGSGGNMSINLSHLGGITKGCNGRTVDHVLVLPTEVIRYEPTLLEVDETTRLVNANFIYIYAGDDAQVDLRKLSPNAVQAYKTITLSVGENSVIDLRGLSDKVFQAAERVEVYADEVLLDEGVTLEDLADAPEISVNPSKILHFVDLDYQSQTKGEPGSILPVHLTLLNNGPTEDTYTITVQDSQGWLLAPYPTEVTVNGLRRSDLFINVKLPTSGNEQTELVVTVTSQSDQTVQKEARIRANVQYPEKVTPRDGRQADVAIVLDGHYRIEDKLQDIADSLLKFLVANGPVSPKDSQMVEWLSQFDESNPLTKEAYLEFLQGFQPINPPPPPVIELITFTDTVKTRVVTDNLADVIGRIRALQTSENETCALASVDAIEYAATNLKEEGHLFLAVASTPNKDMSAAIEKLQQLKVKAHVLLAENCDGRAETALAYQTLSGKTGGIFRLTTEDEETDLLVLEDLLEMILSTGKYSARGTIKDKEGEPIEGVIIELNTKTTTTDSLGNWEISNLAEGEYPVMATKDGYFFDSTTCVVSDNEMVCEPVFKAEPVLEVKVVPEPRIAKQGENVTYSITVTNQGEGTATSVTLADILPDHTDLVSIDALDGGSCEAETIRCSLPDLTPGATANVKVVINNQQTESLINTVTVTTQEYPTDIKKTWTQVIPYLSVTVTDQADPIEMLKVLHYKVTVELSHYAHSDATGITLVSQLPKGVELKSLNSDYGICNTSAFPKITCEMNDLSIATADKVSHATVEMDVELKDAGLLLLTHEAKVTANEYPAHLVRERTNISIPDDIQVDLALVVDSTGSMQEEINGVIKALTAFTNQIDPSKAPLMALLTFGDEVKMAAFTRDLSVLRGAIEDLTASGGGLCPEASIEALSVAIPHTKAGGDILLITDASPYPDADVEKVMRLLRSKGIRFNPMVTGDCSMQKSWN
ncbi:MAG TPA: DUF11 domain-containing protein [Thiotrichaceae bacterium]|nr:DUF11 domain-containing protein [Thiotrichaceae bacterium]